MLLSNLAKIIILSCLSSAALTNEIFPPLKLGVPGNKPGDIIAPVIDEQIAAWCDFNKQIVVTKKNVLCVYNGAKIMPEPKAVSAVNSKETLAKKKPTPAVPKELNPTLYEMSEYSAG
jgi:hypothetical protein